MFVIFIRTVVTFVLLEIVVRLMGKRHMGELEIGELVTTLMISEIATLPLQDASIPLLHSVIPIFTLMFLEIGGSIILTKLPGLKRLITPGPNIIIEKGHINQRELKRLRISAEELMSTLRQSNVSHIEDVNYAIMEQNASITVIPKASAEQTDKDTQQKGDAGIPHILIVNGITDETNMHKLGIGKDRIQTLLNEKGCKTKDVFLMTIDDNGHVTIIRKED